MAVTNTPDKSEMKAMTSNRPVSEMVECEPCPFCGAATTLPPNTPYIRHPPNGCYFANHNIRFQNWQKRASSQAPSDDAVESLTGFSLDAIAIYTGNAADLIQQQQATIERLSAALEDCFAAACDYNLDERAHRNKITAIARTALGKDAK